MTFPIPAASSSESADSQRDERKRIASPPSFFFSQSQAILLAVRYFEPLHSGYEGAAKKHKNRTRSALFVQLMASFEFAMKDFIAQTLDATHIYDDEVKNWRWVEIDVPTVMSTREGFTRLGAVLIHPLLGWQVPETMNSRFKDVYTCEPIASDEIQKLRDLWIVRHSIAHNGGFVTQADARRLRSQALSDRQVLVDLAYIESAVELLRRIVLRLESVVGQKLLKRWFQRAAARRWSEDEPDYARIKLLATCVRSRTQELPVVDEAMYNTDLAAYG